MNRPLLAFSIDFEGFVESMEESVPIAPSISRFQILDELQRNAEHCVELLDRHGVSCTFFVLGWIAERFPAIVRTLASNGHEIGSHSYWHKRLNRLPVGRAAEDILRSRLVIEDAVGRRVRGFRAPDFSLSSDLLHILSDKGYEYDSSVNPTNVHDVYGGTALEGIRVMDGGLIEFPIPVVACLGRRMSFGGGGYFRLFPYRLTRHLLLGHPHPIVYLHPYEISGMYPDVPMSRRRRFRHTFGNGRLEGRLADLFATFEVTPVAGYLGRRGYLNDAKKESDHG